MNLGAFAVVAFVRNTMHSEDISDYSGLVQSAPGLTVCFCIILFSLIGIPPLAGFLGKLLIFESLVTAYTAPAMALLVIGGLNTALALVYYLRVIKVMTVDGPPEHRPPAEFSLVSLPGAYLVAITLPLVLLIFDWNALTDWTLNICRQLVLN
jgi:NADH-quinone oxidoreductase subunit N